MSSPWLFRFSILLSIGFLFVLTLGAVVTNQFASAASTASASTAFAIHRHAAETLGLLVLVLAIWVTFGGARGSGRSLAKRLAWSAVAGVIIEVLLGAASVPLTPGVAFGHAFFGQIVFGIVVAVTVLAWPGWGVAPTPLADKGWPSLRGLSRNTIVLIVIQIILGAAFRHNFAGVLWHILGAFLVVLFVVGLLVLLTQTQGGQSLRPAVIALGVLLGVQVTLGMVLISISDQSKHPEVVLYSTVAHVLTGASTFAVTIVMAMMIRRSVGRPEPKAA